MLRVTRYSAWGRNLGLDLQPMTVEQFTQLVREDARSLMGLPDSIADTYAGTAGHVARIGDRFSLGARFRYDLERVA